MFIHDVYPTRTTRPAAKIRDGRPATEAYIIPISIAALREKLLTRFISRLFYIRWESKADASRAKQRASVDVLYDLFEKLSPKRIGKAMNNHIRRMRREGKIPKVLDWVIDSVIIELSVKSLNKSRFEKIGLWLRVSTREVQVG